MSGAGRWLLLLLRLALPALAVPARAQTPLLLEEALARADRAAYTNRIAVGRSREQAGQALDPYRGILPSVRVESAYLRTTDPLSSFGFLLRQRAVTPAAFAPATLNDPAAIGNLMTGLVIEQPLFNPDAWAGRSATRAAREATEASERWTRSTTALDVVRAYYGAVLAGEEVVTLNSAKAAADAHLRQAESLVRQGLATRSDALLAAVRAGVIETRLLESRSGVRQARRSLATLLGDPADTTWSLPDSLPGGAEVRLLASLEVEAGSGPAPRADVAAAEHGRRAADADARRAAMLYLPRVNGFGRLEWNSPETPFGGRSAWTLGLMVSWSPFAGAHEVAEIRSAGGRQAAARAMVEAAHAQATLELAQARDRLAVALDRLEIAERAVSQATEAHRIVARKYDGGLATVGELLDAAAVETASRLGAASAHHGVIVAIAEFRQASGRDLSLLLDLER